MNIRLVCAASSKLNKGSYLIYKNGKVENSEVFSIRGKDDDSKLKEYTLEAVIKGLRSVKNLVNHDDLLLIELYNTHLVEWLNGGKEYKGYSKYLDEVSEIIETLDCKYLFTKTKVKEAVKMLSEGISTAKVVGIEDAFEGLE